MWLPSSLQTSCGYLIQRIDYQYHVNKLSPSLAEMSIFPITPATHPATQQFGRQVGSKVCRQVGRMTDWQVDSDLQVYTLTVCR